MALSGFNFKDAYIVITNIFYEKDLKRCTVYLSLYENQHKTNLLANTSVVVEGGIEIPVLESLTNLRTSPPENLENKYYLIGKNATDEWLGCDDRLTRRSIFGNWDSWIPTNNSWFMFVEDEQKYYRFIDGQWVCEIDPPLDSRVWNKYLAPEVSMAEGTNITKQMYEVLKLTNKFKDCVDC